MQNISGRPQGPPCFYAKNTQPPLRGGCVFPYQAYRFLPFAGLRNARLACFTARRFLVLRERDLLCRISKLARFAMALVYTRKSFS